ncbi:MAG TPA: sulfatase-like hydrolase/transferase [Chitinophagaceae bacterium]|nr:sulfatase-like hydrolase/transferase [Chitinophagaceae bacterium]
MVQPKNPAFKTLLRHRFGPLLVMALLVTGVSLLTRLGLLIISFPELDNKLAGIFGALLLGLLYDLVVASFFCLPLAFYCWLMKDSWYRSKRQRPVLYLFFIISILLIVFTAIAEFVFWDEFKSRFNFIAVDYLVYTNEVMNNIIESYNMPLVISGLLLAGALLFLPIRKWVDLSQTTSLRFKKRTAVFLVYLLVPLTGYLLVNSNYRNITANRYINELAGNGMYEFGHAFWNNELDYKTFYASRTDSTCFAMLRNLLQEKQSRFTGEPLFSTERMIVPDSAETKRNIVLISVESLSASFLQHFGDTSHITPFLDSLIDQSLFFEHFFASGTRTVRGLEALSLSIPPTPGQSIVKRLPTREDMFTLGNVLKAKGYDTKYIYGGNAFFDNMGAFFGNNGYSIVDQGDIPAAAIHHETAWGVADEDLFTQAMLEMDKSYAAGKLFFDHIMTVSNHRPYTYPEGRIDIPPSRQVREGAVKYTDWSIGHFLQAARSKPWFANTIFVIVADHCAKVAGKTAIPVMDYHIPCWIYAPGIITPRIETKLTAQIDLAPTLLGLMHLQYKSKFYGYDILQLPAGRERLFMGTYQNIGYARNNKMVVLSPQQKIEMFSVDFITGAQTKIPLEDSLVNEAITWYQTASYLFKKGAYKK